ncbi:TonB-dependent receptor domain-containing protein [Erythrobacter sp. BLCC-B19]|uniref:TonB-dependent receptor domain-containing protein n=1 Tax=Erythrobacter sp. BLCC-B19 TaxID=3025315 RepID=UPI00235F1C4E|nr:TonB-dependent receptor [Erythrobacter sp. BLCC-B19]WDA40188.1 TonB-dependent receptor [Erythrobacter sp. BLCC-B19]
MAEGETEETAEASAAESAAPPAPSQTPAAEVFSTGMAKGRDRLDSATSTSSLKGDDIDRFGPRPLGDVLRTMAGLRVATGIGEGNNNYTVRGLPLAAGGSKYMQFQEDGLPVLEFGDLFNVATDVYLRNDFSVSAIETIRGGSASTFASNSPGGIVNVISRTGEQEGGRVQVTAGLDFEEKRIDFDYGAKLGENTRMYVGGFYRQGEGPRDIGFTGWRGGQIKANITRTFDKGYVRAYFKLLDDRSPTFAPYAVNITGTNDNPTIRSFPGFDLRRDSTLSPYLGAVLTLDRNNNPVALPISTGQSAKSKSIGLEAQFELGGWTITEKARYAVNGGDFSRMFPNRQNTVSAFANSIGGAGSSAVYASGPLAGQTIPGGSLINGNGLLSLYFVSFVRARSLDNFTNDLRASKVWDVSGGKLTTTAGLYFATQELDTTWLHTAMIVDANGGGEVAQVDIVNAAGQPQTLNGYFAFGRESSLFRRIFDVDYRVLAPYGSVNFHIGKLAVGGSLRYDSGRVRGQLFGADLGGGRQGLTSFDFNRDGVINPAEARTAFLPLDRPAPVNYDYGYLNYSVGVNYRVAEPFSVFARYSKGARAAADKVLFTPTVNPLTGNVPSGDRQDDVIQYEAGFKLRRNGITVNGTVFHVEAEDQNVLNGAANATNRVYEAQGVELEGNIVRGPFSLMLAATYTEAKIVEDRIGGVFTGKEPRHQPDWVFVAVPQVDFGTFAAGANIVTITGSFSQDSNQLRMPGFTTVGAYVEVQPAENLRLTVSAQNLFDTLGIFEVNQASVPANGIGFARAANGRTVQASLRLAF